MEVSGDRVKHRLVKLIVQPVIVRDDGEDLTELGVEPIVVPARELDELPEKMRASLAALDEGPSVG